jgi:hypothetical protein
MYVYLVGCLSFNCAFKSIRLSINNIENGLISQCMTVSLNLDYCLPDCPGIYISSTTPLMQNIYIHFTHEFTVCMRRYFKCRAVDYLYIVQDDCHCTAYLVNLCTLALTHPDVCVLAICCLQIHSQVTS